MIRSITESATSG